MSQRERDVLKVMQAVFSGQRTQVEAARLLDRCVRQVRRIQRKLQAEGDLAVVHKLRGRPSNRSLDPSIKQRALELYQAHYHDFGPTFACEKLAEEHGVVVTVRTFGNWLAQAGLWQRERRRDTHRSRRERRACFGELVQADASEHDWLEGRGERFALLGIIDDATSRVLARFYPSETLVAYMDLLGRWIGKQGRPVAWYSDRDSIFQAFNALGEAVPTQFSRAAEQLDMQLILAHSPQAKGRVERLWKTAQDRLVKELRLADATTMRQANAVLEGKFLPWFNRRCTLKPVSGNDAHRDPGNRLDLAAILSVQHQRRVSNDYTIRFENRCYQLLAPAWPGERGGRVTIERRLDGSMHIRFKQKYLAYRAIEEKGQAAPDGGRLRLAPGPIPAAERSAAAVVAKDRTTDKAARSGMKAAQQAAVHRSDGRSGRTPALPCPAVGGNCGSSSNVRRPAKHHPWRKSFLRKPSREPDISNCGK